MPFMQQGKLRFSERDSTVSVHLGTVTIGCLTEISGIARGGLHARSLRNGISQLPSTDIADFTLKASPGKTARVLHAIARRDVQ